MAVTVTHSKVSAVADGGDPSLIQPSDWNAGHSISGLPSGDVVGTSDTQTLTNKTLDYNSNSILNLPVQTTYNTLNVTNLKANDGTASMTLADATGVATFSANPILNAGTANGVLYLNGSKVATSGSALTFDGTTLQTAAARGTYSLKIYNSSDGSVAGNFGALTGNVFAIDATGPANTMTFLTGGSEQMRLTSTGLGIGTSSPATKLAVNGGSIHVDRGTGGGGSQLLMTFGASSGANFGQISNTGTYWALGYGGSQSTVGTQSVIWDASGNLGIGQTPNLVQLAVKQSTTYAFEINNSELTQNYSWRIDSGVGNALVLGTRTTSTDLLWLSTSGNLGIGTNSPAYKLDVNGTGGVRFTGTNSNRPVTIDTDVMIKGETGSWAVTHGFIGSSGTNRGGFGALGTADAINYYWIGSAYNSNQFVLNSDGNLGIGTSSPGTLLHGSSGRSILTWNSTTTNNDAMIALTNSTDSSRAEILANTDGTGGATYLALGTRNTSGSTIEHMRLNSSGNLGIGTISPGAKLNVEGAGPIQALLRTTGASSYTSLRLYNDQNSSGRALEIDYSGSTFSGSLLAGGPTGEQASIGTTGAYPLVFGTNNTARAVLDSSGNLGIGTASPGAKLDVVGAVRASLGSGGVAMSGDSTPDLGFLGYNYTNVSGTETVSQSARSSWRHRFGNGSTNVWSVGYRAANAAASSWTEHLTLDSSGNLGLGVTPSAWGGTYKGFQIGQGGLMSRTGGSDVYLLGNNYYDGTNFRYINTSFASRYQQDSGVHAWYTALSGNAGDQISFGDPKMTLDASGNLGIGTSSPGARLHLGPSTAVTGISTSTLLIDGYSTDTSQYRILWNHKGSGYLGIGTASDTNGSMIFGQATGAAGTVSLEWMRLDTSGNLGLGVTPSASSAKTLEIGFVGSTVIGRAVNTTDYTQGAYYNGGWKYANSTYAAAVYEQQAGAHYWLTSTGVPSAGGPISFTQAMTLDASGRLGVGETSPAYKLVVKGSSSGENIVHIANSAGTSDGGATNVVRFTCNSNTNWANAQYDAYQHIFNGNGFERARITSAGDLVINKFADFLYVDVSTTRKPVLGAGYDGDINADYLKIGAPVANTGANSDIRFFTGTWSGYAERARITSDGNLLVGTTSNSGYKVGVAVASSGTFQGAYTATNGADSDIIIGIKTNETRIFNTGSIAALTFGTANTERARITSGGNLDLQKNLGLGGTSATTSGTGITFPATQDASANANTLDDYEEGSFTPGVDYDSTGSLSVTYSTRNGSYTKIGNLVTISIQIRLTSFSKGSASGEMGIWGLPFTVGNATGDEHFVGSLVYYDTPFNGIPVCFVAANTTVIRFRATSNNAGWATQPDPDGNSQWFITLTYRTAT